MKREGSRRGKEAQECFYLFLYILNGNACMEEKREGNGREARAM